MSQGNASLGEGSSASRQFLSLVKAGAAFSGRERHCAFLNRHDGTFANVSSISGLDLPEDGRGAARVDWDGDGDLDLWVSNRTGPQLRYFRNDLETSNTHLTLELEGRTSNRDAVGARVEVYLEGESVPLVRSLRAGSGFLSQSSKRLHFGLGSDAKISRVVVRWPEGLREEHTSFAAGSNYRLVQGADQAEILPRRNAKALPVNPSAPPSAPSEVHTLTHSLTPLPPLRYRPWSGSPTPVFRGNPRLPDRPVLLNLWASWCVPCQSELAEFEKHHDQLAAAGLDLVAVSVDPLGPDGDLAAAQRLIRRLAPSLASGTASPALIEKLQLVHDMTFELHTDLPVPTSFLIDSRGRMAAIYKGAVPVSRILADAKKIDLSTDERRAASLPFPGRWFSPPRPLHLFNLAWQLFERDHFDDAMIFYALNASRIKDHPNHPRLLLMMGDGCARNGRIQLARRMFEQALQEAPAWQEPLDRLHKLPAGP